MTNKDCASQHKTAISPALLEYLQAHPVAAQGYNVSLDGKRWADPDVVRRAAQFVVMVGVRLAPSVGVTWLERAREERVRKRGCA